MMQRNMTRTATRLAALALLLCAPPLAADARADEGMWTFDNPPTRQLAERYGFTPTPAWLERVRLASVRLAGGCSGSFVSPDGLVLTNHHCVHHCIEQLSTKQKDYVAQGFYAQTAADELRCPDVELNQLQAITDVTARIGQATRGQTGEAYATALKGAMTAIEKECATSADVRCDVVTLYHGGQYHLYRYRRFQDVRLVFAPELASAFFGGDPDNFMFPRYVLDAAFLRAYDGGKPAKMQHFFPWSPSGAAEGDLTFVTGHPGSTSRLYTMAELAYERDVLLTRRLMRFSELRGLLTEFSRRSPEHARIAKGLLFGIENAVKAYRGMHEALLDPALMQAKAKAEQALRQRVAADPKLAEHAGAWDAIAQAMAAQKALDHRYTFIERGAGFHSDLFRIARHLVRASDERTRPNTERLREYTDAQLPALEQRLFSTAPIHDELEIATLTFSLTKMREALGPDDPFVKQILGSRSPEQVAAAAVRGSKLKDVKLRRALYEGGAAAVAASKDPMIALARAADPEARRVRKQYETEVEAVLKKNREHVAQALFAIYGTDTYPDATFTLRLSYGKVAGWQEDGRTIAPFTRFAGAFERHTGADPFALPPSWLKARPNLDLTTPLNFVTTNDIIGGNSGSPVIDREARVVGLIFDGNIHSLGGDYGFDERLNRAVAVHSQAILHALDRIYGARRLLEELRPR